MRSASSRAKRGGGAGSDFEKAEEIIEKFGLSSLYSHIEEVMDFQRDETNWRAVERFAHELVEKKTLGFDEVDMLLSLADGEISGAEYEQFLAFLRACRDA